MTEINKKNNQENIISQLDIESADDYELNDNFKKNISLDSNNEKYAGVLNFKRPDPESFPEPIFSENDEI